MESEPPEEATLFPTTVGEKLRAARVAKGLDLSEVAARTRIPQRHLEAIEASNYTGLPSITYAMGFTKAYARVVGADEATLGKELRTELSDSFVERASPAPAYEAQDPSRVPPRGLAIFGVIVALVVLIGAGIWYGTDWFRGAPPSTDNAPLVEQAPAAAPSAAPAPAATPTPTAAQVTLTASDAVWVRVADASGKALFEKTMTKGETYTVPGDANAPVLSAGRPDLLAVTVNGSSLPPLGTAKAPIKNVPLTPAALQARAAGVPAPDAGTAAPHATRTAAPPRVSASPKPAPAAAAANATPSGHIGDVVRGAPAPNGNGQ